MAAATGPLATAALRATLLPAATLPAVEILTSLSQAQLPASPLHTPPVLMAHWNKASMLMALEGAHWWGGGHCLYNSWLQ